MIIDRPRRGQRNVEFGHRKPTPRVCIVDGKPHIRRFLADALEELGFIARHCASIRDITAALTDEKPDLVVLGLLTPESDVTKVLGTLAMQRYTGKTMLFGGRASVALLALHNYGEGLGLTMLPPLRTPYRDSDLHENLADFLPISPPPTIPLDVEEALRRGWLELWYQPKIELHQMALHSVEALTCARHPTWGVIPPSRLLPDTSDPQLRALSEFVIRHAMIDWQSFMARRPTIGMGIHLPLRVLESTDFIEQLCVELPDHAVRGGLTVEISSIDFCQEPNQVRRAAQTLAAYNVGVSIDDVMSQMSWADMADFPIAELQVDASFIDGCAGDRDKRAICGLVKNLAERIGARTTAKGVANAADCRAVSDMGFDLAEGPLFAKPMEPDKLLRSALRGAPARKT